MNRFPSTSSIKHVCRSALLHLCEQSLNSESLLLWLSYGVVQGQQRRGFVLAKYQQTMQSIRLDTLGRATY